MAAQRKMPPCFMTIKVFSFFMASTVPILLGMTRPAGAQPAGWKHYKGACRDKNGKEFNYCTLPAAGGNGNGDYECYADPSWPNTPPPPPPVCIEHDHFTIHNDAHPSAYSTIADKDECCSICEKRASCLAFEVVPLPNNYSCRVYDDWD
eukprot:gene289-5746_t